MTTLHIEDAITFLIHKCHSQAFKSGFWDESNEMLTHLQDGELGEAGARVKHYTTTVKLSKAALMQSELGEFVEGIRKPGPDQHLPHLDQEAVELADTIIRILDYCGYFSIPLGQALEEKMEYNSKRPYKHGKEA